MPAAAHGAVWEKDSRKPIRGREAYAVLRSPIAVDISIRVMDAFVAMRRVLISMAPVFARIDATERRLLKQEAAQTRNEGRFEKIFDAMSDKSFPPQKVFFEGQFYDAFVQMKRFVVGEVEFSSDLMFYHRTLKCMVAVLEGSQKLLQAISKKSTSTKKKA